MKSILMGVTLTFLSIYSYAQTVKGKVTDLQNNPLAGATISFNGKGGTTSDKDGVFTLDCSKVKSITVSFIGYTTVAKAVKNCNDEIVVVLSPSSQSLNEVEITATSSNNKSILYQPSSIVKLGPVELKRGTGIFMDDAINTNIPGVTMQRRTVSAGQNFNIRGYGNGVRGTNGINSNFDGQGSKVYLNGIAITDAEGITFMDDIDFGSVGDVEVIKGPAGTLYGLAVAGVVNLKTVRPEKGKVSVGQDLMTGSYGLRRATTHFQMGTDKSSLLVNYGVQKTDGYMSHTASDKRFVNVAGDFDISEKQSISTYFGYSRSYDERGGELTLTQYANKDYTGNPEYIKRNAHSEVISFRLGAGHTYRFSNQLSNTTTVFGTGISSNVSSAGGWTDKDPINVGVRSTFDTKFAVGNGSTLSGITGIEAQRQHAQTIGYNMVANPSSPTAYWIVGAARSNQFTLSSTQSLFTEWSLALPNDLSFTAGVGVSGMRIELNDRFYVANSTLPTKYEKKYKGMVSPHFAINKVFSKQFSAYVSYSKGYKAPVSSYFFIPTTGKLNTGLKPEIGNQIEIGTKGALLNSKLNYQIALFSAQFKDKMTAIAVPLNGSTTTTAYSYIANGGSQDNKGIEVLVHYTLLQKDKGFLRSIRPFGNLAYSKFKYKDYKFQTLNANRTAVVEVNYDGKDVAGVAPVTANLGLDIQAAAGIYANVSYNYKDKMPITSDNVNMTTSYNLLNAKLGIRQSLSRHFDIDLYGGATNLTGTQYPLMVFVNQLPDAYLPAPLKTNYFAGINLKYNF